MNSSSNNSNPSWAIIGLGNPGIQFKSTRHNVGLRCIEKIAHHSKIDLKEKKNSILYGIGIIGGTSVF